MCEGCDPPISNIEGLRVGLQESGVANYPGNILDLWSLVLWRAALVVGGNSIGTIEKKQLSRVQ